MIDAVSAPIIWIEFSEEESMKRKYRLVYYVTTIVSSVSIIWQNCKENARKIDKQCTEKSFKLNIKRNTAICCAKSSKETRWWKTEGLCKFLVTIKDLEIRELANIKDLEIQTSSSMSLPVVLYYFNLHRNIKFQLLLAVLRTTKMSLGTVCW